MLYKNDLLLNWDRKQGLTQEEAVVRQEILEIENKYFSEDTPKRLRLLYPKGKPKIEEENDGYHVLKMFQIPLNSADGQWRWTKSKMTKKGYVDAHREMKHADVLTVKDKEFVWFLLNRSSVLNKYIFIEDLEGDAKEEVDKISIDADIKYMIMGSKSPLSRDEDTIRNIADIFGLRDVNTLKFNQVKIALYDAIKEGEEMGDKFVNFEKFDELAGGSSVRRAAFIARTAIQEKSVGYKDRAWWIMAGKSFEEKLMNVNPKDVPYRENVLIDEVVRNASVKDRLYSAVGEVDVVTIEYLRDLDRNVLRKKHKELKGKDKNASKEELIEIICGELEIEYLALTE